MFVNFVYLHNAINRLISIETVHLLRRRVLLLFFVQARFRYCYEQVFRIYNVAVDKWAGAVSNYMYCGLRERQNIVSRELAVCEPCVSCVLFVCELCVLPN